MPEPTAPDEVRQIDGQDCTNRAGVAAILGRTLQTVKLRATTDPDFPQPVGPRVDRQLWYPVAAIEAYRDQQRPQAQLSGNPNELVGWTELAVVWQVSEATVHRYLYRSRAVWATNATLPADQQRLPLVPMPDVGFDPGQPDASTPQHWRWRRRTLAEYRRPGRGAGGGRPH